MRVALLLMLLAVGALACRGSAAPNRTADGASTTTGIDFAYGIDAARPRTSFDLHIPSAGDADLYLGAPVGAEETDTLGYFRAPLAAETRDALARLVRSGDLLSRSDSTSATAEGSGFLRLSGGSSKAELSLTHADAPVDALRAKLDEVVVEIARHPLRAIRMSLGATRDGATFRPEITLAQVGTEPLSVLYFDSANPAFCLHASVSAGAGGPRSELTRSDVAALVQTKVLPDGVSVAPVGGVVHIPLAPLTVSASNGVELSGSVILWLPGTGASKRPVELRTRTRVQ